MRSLSRLGPFVENSFALFALLFMLGGYGGMLRNPGATESTATQVLGGGIGVLALLGLMLSAGVVHRMVVNYWPALVAPAFAVFSIVWAAEPLIAARRIGALVLTTIFAIWLAERINHRTILRLLTIACLLLCLLCWYAILFQPRLGIHQIDDIGGNPAHDGAWRGVFSHKNDFGRALGLMVLVFVVAMLVYRRLALFFVLVILQCGVLIVGSRSSQAVLLAALPSAAIVLLYVTRDMTTAKRSMIIAITLPLAWAAYMLQGFFFSLLLNFLGRDETLTGRTEIWTAVIEASQSIAVFGGGFGTGWSLIADHLASVGIGVGHAHNGYLDLVVDLGIVGVFLCVLFMLVLGKLAFRNAFSPYRTELGTLALGYVVFYLVGNWAGSFLLVYNTIYWVLPVTCFCTLSRIHATERSAGVGFAPIMQRVAAPPPAGE